MGELEKLQAQLDNWAVGSPRSEPEEARLDVLEASRRLSAFAYFTCHVHGERRGSMRLNSWLGESSRSAHSGLTAVLSESV